MDSEATAAENSLAGRTIGAVLGAARTAHGLDLTDIARDTRVPVRHLAAIEADDHDHLPALPYAIGFVKAFARAVGIDAEAAGAQFRAETSKAAHVPVAPAMTPLDERRLPPRGVVAASLAALLVVVALVVAWSAGAFDPAAPTAPVVATAAAPAATTAPAATPPVETGTTPAPAALSPVATTAGADAPATSAASPATATSAATPPAAAPAAAPTTTAPAATAPTPAGGVVITASEDAWFKVSVFDPAAGKVVTVKTGVLAKGERYVPPATPGLRLWTGRAGALAITVDGRQVPPLGGPVETVKNVSLDPADLRARVPRTVPAPGRAGPPVG